MKMSTAVAVAATLVLLSPASATASPRDYCESYARDIVAQRASGTGILTGATQGAVRVAKAGDASEGQDSALERVQEVMARDYEQALNDCIAQYEAAPAVTEVSVAPEAPKPRKLVQSAKLEPGSQEWVAYCTAKYKSFNADAGTYTSYSGVERPCRVTE
jgi:hypothetical protein